MKGLIILNNSSLFYKTNLAHSHNLFVLAKNVSYDFKSLCFAIAKKINFKNVRLLPVRHDFSLNLLVITVQTQNWAQSWSREKNWDPDPHNSWQTK